ncbi:reticulon-4 receptor [Dasypus novemcinctus]|uniref:reticulon-4 receptor n=1 Tax=Dasypus novemcinctus TaxID=9361 RepID=UPI00265E9465|nr:reticulon-4 receptor [Dasypus novemcinctus]
MAGTSAWVCEHWAGWRGVCRHGFPAWKSTRGSHGGPSGAASKQHGAGVTTARISSCVLDPLPPAPGSSLVPAAPGPSDPRPLTPCALPSGSGLLAWALCLQAWQAAAPCPGACVCYDEPKVTTSCPQQGLQAVPADIPAASQRIFLHGNHIAHVPASSFRACRNLTILWLHSNALARVDAAAFAGLALLEQLDLSDNAQLRAVDPATFRGLGRLHTLHLDRCGLQELGPGLFRGLAALQYLYLQDNWLQALPDDAFRDLGNLTHLFLHGNRIRSVPERALRGLHSLDRLLLHQNRVARVHPLAFRDLGRLMTLYLFANNLSALPAEALAPLRSLQYLRLNDNPWVCDCRARPLWAWLQGFRGSSSEVPCSLPPRLAGRDLKRLAAPDLEGCAAAPRPSRPIWTEGVADEEPPGLPKCCQPDAADKTLVLGAGGPASAGNALKGRGPPGDGPLGNGSRPRHINDSPFGTPPGSAEPPPTALRPEGSEPPGPLPTGPRRRPGCSRKNRTRSHCRLGQAGAGGAGEVEGSGVQPGLAGGLAALGLLLALWTALGPC